MRKVIIFTPISNEIALNRNLQIYWLLKKHSNYEVSIYNQNNDAKFDHFYRTYNQPIRSIKNTIILLFGYHKDLLSLHSSNRIIYFARSANLYPLEILLLPKINHIIAETNYEKYNLAWQAKYYSENIKVSKLIPWVNSKKYKFKPLYQGDTIYCSDTKINESYFDPYKIEYKNYYPENQARYYLTNNKLYSAIQFMLEGKPVISSPMLEDIIINGYTGYTVRTTYDLHFAINQLKNKNQLGKLANNSRDLIQTLLEPKEYVKSLTNILEDRIIEPDLFRKQKIPKSEQKIIIREKILKRGKFEFFPKEFNKSLEEFQSNDINEILEELSERQFEQVYIFNPEFPNYSQEEMSQTKKLLNSLGNRAYKIFVYNDDEIPSDWKFFFQKISCLPIKEGLKHTLG